MLTYTSEMTEGMEVPKIIIILKTQSDGLVTVDFSPDDSLLELNASKSHAIPATRPKTIIGAKT